MARVATGMAIASSAAKMDRQRLGQRGADATNVPANDSGSRLTLIDRERDIRSVLAAEYTALITYSQRLTANGPEAADLVHIVCIRVLSQPPVSGVENLSGWLRTVVFHTFVDFRRRARREIPTDPAVLDQSTTAFEPETCGPSVTMDDLRALVSALPAHYRVPFELFVFEHMRYAQIATMLGVSCSTVGTRINRARQRLRLLIRARQGR
jgi:RNA polymerase sigma-70 factor (ECF subfamily)